MRRAVITGMGIVSCLGNDKATVTNSLRNGISGIQRREDFAEMGLRCNVGGLIDLDPKDHIDRKVLRFMGDSAAYGYIAADRAIADAGLSEEMVSNHRTGLIMGSGGLSGEMFVEAVDVMRARGIKRAGPYRVTQIMASTVSACVATPLKIYKESSVNQPEFNTDEKHPGERKKNRGAAVQNKARTSKNNHMNKK